MNIKRTVIQNDERMKWMMEHFECEYFILFGEMILSGVEVQKAIDDCYEFFWAKFQSENN